ncbi:hypothetical protein PAPHI01_2122 [Pancytospora philotis]|nr:hypothetical protein PAPHI01_2122 [Pancytospora philotis]
MLSPIVKSLCDSTDEAVSVEATHGRYEGTLRSCDACMNLQIETAGGLVYVPGATIKYFSIDPERAYAPYFA